MTPATSTEVVASLAQQSPGLSWCLDSDVYCPGPRTDYGPSDHQNCRSVHPAQDPPVSELQTVQAAAVDVDRRCCDWPMPVQQVRRRLKIRYDTRCYFNVRSKANMSQLNLPHGTDD